MVEAFAPPSASAATNAATVSGVADNNVMNPRARPTLAASRPPFRATLP
jgi:hypothetical protein